MKLRKICALFTAVACMSSHAAFAAGQDVYINGEKIEDALVSDDTVYVSLEAVGEAIGAQITRDEVTGSITVNTNYDAAVIDTIESVSESVVAIVGNYDDGYTSAGVQDYNEMYAHGAGVVIKSNGTILTNAHVVKDIENLTVIFGNGRTYAGMVKYIDETSDLAVVRINEQDLKPIKFAPEGSLTVGQSVIAIGTPLSVNLINAATKGMVSGVNVNIGEHYLFTQSDVAINGGNSGGPLINLNGELVGINSIKYAGSGIEGLSFSIPVDTINYVLDSFEKYGRVVRPETGVEMSEPWEILLGVPTTKGLTVTSSESELLMPGDMITHVNSYEVHSIADYNEAIKKSFNGESISVTYKRNGVVATVDIPAEADYTREDDGRVEIGLKSGDTSLLVNGELVETQAPFVTGDGVTMVPLRVIVEAFGAEAEWTQETLSITIRYNETEIIMQIGSLAASVNGEEKEIAAAPVLLYDVTMVPLRFIGETFGAEVDYNNDTGEITVIKEAGIEGSTISSSTDLPRIGDDYWNWSMLRPASMMMTDRTLDGKQTSFSGEDGYIDIAIIEEEDSADSMTAQEMFDEAYDSVKNSDFASMVVSRNEKGEDEEGNQYFRIAARSKSAVEEIYCILSGDIIYTIAFYSYLEEDNSKAYSNIISSFKPTFAANEEEKSQTYNLSSMDEDGYAVMNDKDLKISFKIPANFTENYQSRSSINYVMYTDGTSYTSGENYVSVKASSKSDAITAEAWAKSDRAIDFAYTNPAAATVSEVEKIENAEGLDNVYYYTVKTIDRIGGDYVHYDIHFEKGEYVYSMIIKTDDTEGKFVEKMKESFTINELDSEAMGVIISEIKECEEKEFSGDGWKLTFNTDWEKSSYSNNFTNIYTAATLSLSISDAKNTTYSNAKEMISGLISYVKSDENSEIVSPIGQKTFGNNTYYTCTVKTTEEDYYTEEDVTTYTTYYVVKKGKSFYRFILSEDEMYYNAKSKQDAELAIGTLSVE